MQVLIKSSVHHQQYLYSMDDISPNFPGQSYISTALYSGKTQLL